MEVVKAINIKKKFKDASGEIRTVLNGVTFSLEKGSRLAVIGPNGAGKTTLLKILATILLPDEGRALIDGFDIIKDINEVRSRISYINPELRLQERLTVKQTLKFFGAIQGVDWKAGLEYLKMFKIDHMLDSPIGALSTGQKAALRFIIGFMKEPRVIFLDEVFSGLDIGRSEILLTVVDNIFREKEITVIMVEHNPDILDRLCDKVLILERGKPVNKLYRVSDILGRFSYKWDIIVTWDTEVDTSLLQKLEQEYGISWITMTADRARIFIQNEELVDAITKALVSSGKGILEINVSPVTLKDLMMDIIENRGVVHG